MLYEIHGLSGTGEHRIWRAMKTRCYNKNFKDYHHYGGRGIKVCERWKNNFKSFYEDMGARPSLKHSLDRINVNGDYEPNNCRWATQSIQVLNSRRKTPRSGYRGVRQNRGGRWIAEMHHNRKRHYLGMFDTPVEAALAYNKSAQAIYGEDARLNSI